MGLTAHTQFLAAATTAPLAAAHSSSLTPSLAPTSRAQTAAQPHFTQPTVLATTTSAFSASMARCVLPLLSVVLMAAICCGSCGAVELPVAQQPHGASFCDHFVAFGVLNGRCARCQTAHGRLGARTQTDAPLCQPGLITPPAPRPQAPTSAVPCSAACWPSSSRSTRPPRRRATSRRRSCATTPPPRLRPSRPQRPRATCSPWRPHLLLRWPTVGVCQRPQWAGDASSAVCVPHGYSRAHRAATARPVSTRCVDTAAAPGGERNTHTC
jgi:hypothetical protein